MQLLCLLKHGCIWSAVKLCSKYECIYFTLMLTFMIKYTYFSFYHGRTTKNAFINVQDFSLEHIRERLADSSY
jgi:hypothetical protein